MFKLTTLAPVAALLAAATLTACGGSDDDNGGGSSDGGAKSPQCSDIWVEGETLETGYDGCYGDDGAAVATAQYDCANGDKWLIGPDGTSLHAVEGGTIERAKGAEVTMSDAPCKMA